MLSVIHCLAYPSPWLEDQATILLVVYPTALFFRNLAAVLTLASGGKIESAMDGWKVKK